MLDSTDSEIKAEYAYMIQEYDWNVYLTQTYKGYRNGTYIHFKVSKKLVNGHVSGWPR